MVSGVRHDGRDKAFEAASGALTGVGWIVSGMALGLSDGLQERFVVTCVESVCFVCERGRGVSMCNVSVTSGAAVACGRLGYVLGEYGSMGLISAVASCEPGKGGSELWTGLRCVILPFLR